MGADALGFIFYPKSPRYIKPEKAAEIIRSLSPFVASVGVFVNASIREIQSVVHTCRLSTVQLHGEEPPEFCKEFSVKVIKAFRIKGNGFPRRISQYSVDALLLDPYIVGIPGGTGTVFNWDVAKRAKRYGRIILAGGLGPENVQEAIQTVDPYAVDVSSGVESSPGKKDHKLLQKFINQVKTA